MSVPKVRVPQATSLMTALVLAAFLTVGMVSQFLSLAFGGLFTEVFVFLAIPWVGLRAQNFKPAVTTQLVPPSVGACVWGLALGAANFFATVVPIQYAMQSVLPQAWLDAFDSSQIFRQQEGIELALIVISVSVFAPLCEEFFFRGVLQPALIRRWNHVGRGILFTAIVFSLFHLDPVGFLARMELGLLFGWLAFRGRGLSASIGAHAGNNLTSTVMFFLLQSPANKPDEASWLTVLAISAAGWLALTALWQLGHPRYAAHSSAGPGINEQRINEERTEEPALAPQTLSRAAAPWVLGAAASWVMLLVFDHRGIMLNVYDSAYRVPKAHPGQTDPYEEERNSLRELRQRTRRGTSSLDDYREQRKRLWEKSKADRR